MITKNKLRILILGASFDTGNMGVNVLATSSAKCALASYPDAELCFLDYAEEPSVRTIRTSKGDFSIPEVNIRFSKKIYLANNIAVLLLLAIGMRCFPLDSVRNWVLGQNPWLRRIDEADLVLSLAGGDSFSDIYGVRRLLYVSLPQILCLWMRKTLILLPQTIGPFKGSFARHTAGYILRRACHIYGRDQQSVTLARHLRGNDPYDEVVAFSHDVGFVLDAIAPKIVDVAGFSLGSKVPRKPLVGLNVSGLLWNGGYTGKNMFGLGLNYQELIFKLIDLFIHEKDAEVLLVPHVFGPVGSESDSPVCEQIWERLRCEYEGQLGLLRGTYDSSELKYAIGLCDFFVGSRMHACIAAISQGVPAVSIAYSDKFAGVMQTIGLDSNVADARLLDELSVLKIVERAFSQRTSIRRGLLQVMPKVKASGLQLLQRDARSFTGPADDPAKNERPSPTIDNGIHVQ